MAVPQRVEMLSKWDESKQTLREAPLTGDNSWGELTKKALMLLRFLLIFHSARAAGVSLQFRSIRFLEWRVYQGSRGAETWIWDTGAQPTLQMAWEKILIYRKPMAVAQKSPPKSFILFAFVFSFNNKYYCNCCATGICHLIWPNIIWLQSVLVLGSNYILFQMYQSCMQMHPLDSTLEGN